MFINYYKFSVYYAEFNVVFGCIGNTILIECFDDSTILIGNVSYGDMEKTCNKNIYNQSDAGCHNNNFAYNASSCFVDVDSSSHCRSQHVFENVSSECNGLLSCRLFIDDNFHQSCSTTRPSYSFMVVFSCQIGVIFTLMHISLAQAIV